MSRRTGVSDWHGGHHEAKKFIQTALPRRSARLIGLPSRSVSVRRRAVGRADRELRRRGRPVGGPATGPGPRMYGVARGSPGEIGDGRAERRRHDHEPDRGDDDRDRGDSQLAPAERPDEPVPLALVGEGRPLVRRRARQTPAKLNQRGSSTSQSMIIAMPIATTSRPPMIETARPCRMSGRSSAGARS